MDIHYSDELSCELWISIIELCGIHGIGAAWGVQIGVFISQITTKYCFESNSYIICGTGYLQIDQYESQVYPILISVICNISCIPGVHLDIIN